MKLNKVLIIAFYFPPAAASSGYLRTLKFSSYLPDHNYKPYVLTAHPMAYAEKKQNFDNTKNRYVTYHAFSLDAQKHLSFKGRYPRIFSLPDRFSTWILPAILKGINLIRKEKIDLIYSTYPISSAHLIGYYLNKLTKLPWVADFRDPMWDEFFSSSKIELKARKNIEWKAIQNCDKIITTTDGIKELFQKRYPELPKEKIKVIHNGFDENDFSELPTADFKKNSIIRFIHAGLLDEIDRNPRHFFNAVAEMLKRKEITPGEIVMDFYSPGNENHYKRLITDLDISNVIRIKPRISYNEIIIEMFNSDALLLFQGESCNTQIPAKLYEYFRIGKPILGVTSAAGESAKLIEQTKSGIIIPINDEQAIQNVLLETIENLKNNKQLPVVDKKDLAKFSRVKQTEELASCFKAVLA